MADCFLKGFGECEGKISREHYISAVVLRTIGAEEGFKVGGLRWQPEQTLQRIGIKSLQSKILCESHNRSLSPLDKVAGELFSTLDAIDKNLPSVPLLSQFDGPNIERWFLKVLCGISASGGFNAESPSDQWKALLTGEPWPEHWGLYVGTSGQQEIFSRDFLIETKVNPKTNAILAALFRFAGVTFYLLFGKPDDPNAFGFHRPRGFIFRHGEEEHRVEFLWPFETEQCIMYTNIGRTSEPPPHHEGWKE